MAVSWLIRVYRFLTESGCSRIVIAILCGLYTCAMGNTTTLSIERERNVSPNARLNNLCDWKKLVAAHVA